MHICLNHANILRMGQTITKCVHSHDHKKWNLSDQYPMLLVCLRFLHLLAINWDRRKEGEARCRRYSFEEAFLAWNARHEKHAITNSSWMNTCRQKAVIYTWNVRMKNSLCTWNSSTWSPSTCIYQRQTKTLWTSSWNNDSVVNNKITVARQFDTYVPCQHRQQRRAVQQSQRCSGAAVGSCSSRQQCSSAAGSSSSSRIV